MNIYFLHVMGVSFFSWFRVDRWTELTDQYAWVLWGNVVPSKEKKFRKKIYWIGDYMWKACKPTKTGQNQLRASTLKQPPCQRQCIFAKKCNEHINNSSTGMFAKSERKNIFGIMIWCCSYAKTTKTFKKTCKNVVCPQKVPGCSVSCFS